jgi:tetratricopeptide (TPR) repeat protein
VRPALILLLTACATAKPVPPADPDPFEKERVLLTRGDEAFDAHDYALAREKYVAAIGSANFPKLSTRLQHAILAAAANAGVLLTRQPNFAAADLQPIAKEVLAFEQRACALPESTVQDWLVRLAVDGVLGYGDDAIESITVLARLDGLKEVEERFVFDAARMPPQTPKGIEAQFQMRLALFNDGWVSASGAQPSWIWQELAISLLERGDPDRAQEVAAQVTDARTLISMRADKRFAEVLVRGGRDQFDVRRSFALDLEERRRDAAKLPRSLEARSELIGSLNAAYLFTEALALADDALKETAARFDDADKRLPWVMNDRSKVLWNLGRFDEAIEQLQAASKLAEDGRPNVSQAINLAGREVEVLRAKDAIALLDAVGSNTSPFGKMAIESMRGRAAVLLRDQPMLDRSLAYLREHKDDSPGALQRTLLAADKIDEAARVLISRLDDPKQRGEALSSLQKFPDLPEPPSSKLWGGRFKKMLERADVRAAIARVGTIETYVLPP